MLKSRLWWPIFRPDWYYVVINLDWRNDSTKLNWFWDAPTINNRAIIWHGLRGKWLLFKLSRFYLRNLIVNMYQYCKSCTQGYQFTVYHDYLFFLRSAIKWVWNDRLATHLLLLLHYHILVYVSMPSCPSTILPFIMLVQEVIRKSQGNSPTMVRNSKWLKLSNN